MSRRARRQLQPLVGEPEDGPETVGDVEVELTPADAEFLRDNPMPSPLPRSGGEYRWSGDILVAPDGHIAAEMRDGELRAPAR
jgi:hypothetical protein